MLFLVSTVRLKWVEKRIEIKKARQAVEKPFVSLLNRLSFYVTATIRYCRLRESMNKMKKRIDSNYHRFQNRFLFDSLFCVCALCGSSIIVGKNVSMTINKLREWVRRKKLCSITDGLNLYFGGMWTRTDFQSFSWIKINKSSQCSFIFGLFGETKKDRDFFFIVDFLLCENKTCDKMFRWAFFINNWHLWSEWWILTSLFLLWQQIISFLVFFSHKNKSEKWKNSLKVYWKHWLQSWMLKSLIITTWCNVYALRTDSFNLKYVQGNKKTLYYDIFTI